MEHIIIKPKSHEEWLKNRMSGIGSSEITAVLGISPYMTRYQLWRSKKGIDPPMEDNFFLKAGRYLEDAVSRFYEDETGRKIIKASAYEFMYQSVEKPFLMASPDRTYWIDQNAVKNNSNKGICECKTTQMQVSDEDVPKHWFCQLQWQLGISGLTHGAIAWLTAGRSFGYKEYLFNQELFDFMVQEAESFWNEYILGDKIPDPESAEDVLLRYKEIDLQNKKDADEDIFKLYLSLVETQEKRVHYKNQEDSLIDKLKVFCGDAEALHYMGQTIATYKFCKVSKKFNESKFAVDYPELFAKYMENVQQRRLYLK